jgi:polysaccharide chain length determinant protein (PEP-CTERM system associated)
MLHIPATVRKYLSLAWRQRWPAILFTWLVCAGGWVLTFTIPNQYEASARLYVDADVVLTPLLRGLAVDSQSAAQLDILQRTLLSRPNLEKLISKTALELDIKDPSDRERMVEGLATAIRISPQTRNLFTISYRNTSPRLAYEVVRSTLTSFVESKTGNSRAEMESAARFLDKTIADDERRLQDAERRRADFRAKYVDVLPSADGGASRLEGQQGQLRELLGQLQDATARRDTLTRALSAEAPQIVTETDGGIGSGNSRLREAERVLQELRTRYTDQNPDVISQRNIIAAIRAAGNDPAPAGGRAGPRSRTASNPVYEALKNKIVDNDSVITSLNRQINDATKERDRLQAIARTAPQLQADYANVNRDYDVVQKRYADLLGRRESMRLSTSAEMEGDKLKVQIIDPPQLPQNPVAPKRLLLVSGVLLAGLAAGCGLAFLLTQLDQSFHTVDDLRTLGFPVVGGVSMLPKTISMGRRVLAAGLFAAAVALPLVAYGGLMLRVSRAGLLT